MRGDSRSSIHHPDNFRLGAFMGGLIQKVAFFVFVAPEFWSVV